jgi:dephospho-CoA kinase
MMAAPPRRPARIALTGGIASGKSTVAGLFAARGIPILDADLMAREVVAPGTPLLERLFERFGPGIRAPDGALERAALRRMVFEDASLRRELEALLHPAIRARMEELAASSPGPYQLHVVPLLIETGARGRFDRVLLIDCPEALQWTRLRERDDLSETQARSMLAAQAGRAERLAAADDVIVNDGPLEALPGQVAALHARYLALAGVYGNRGPQAQ